MKKKILLSLILQMIHKYLSNGMYMFGKSEACPLCKYTDLTCKNCILGIGSHIGCDKHESYYKTKITNDYIIRLFFWCLMWDHVNQQPMVFFSKLSNIRQLTATLDIRAVDTYNMYVKSNVDHKDIFIAKAIEILKN